MGVVSCRVRACIYMSLPRVPACSSIPHLSALGTRRTCAVGDGRWHINCVVGRLLALYCVAGKLNEGRTIGRRRRSGTLCALQPGAWSRSQINMSSVAQGKPDMAHCVLWHGL